MSLKCESSKRVLSFPCDTIVRRRYRNFRRYSSIYITAFRPRRIARSSLRHAFFHNNEPIIPIILGKRDFAAISQQAAGRDRRHLHFSHSSRCWINQAESVPFAGAPDEERKKERRNLASTKTGESWEVQFIVFRGIHERAARVTPIYKWKKSITSLGAGLLQLDFESVY